MADATQRPDVRLEIDGKLYGGWKDISITRSLEQCAGTFELSVTDRWHSKSSRARSRRAALVASWSILRQS